VNTGTILDAAAARDPARAALIIDGQFITYGELAAAVQRCAAGLAANGTRAGDRVAVILDVGGKSVANIRDLRQALSQAKSDGKHDVLMRVKTSDNTHFVAVPIG